jgi:hypothetical protein
MGSRSLGSRSMTPARALSRPHPPAALLPALLPALLQCACAPVRGPSPTPELDELEAARAGSAEAGEGLIEGARRAQPTALTPSAVCASCHPQQARDLEGATMRYAFTSPAFNALELTLNALSGGRFAHGGASGGFCSACHSPRATLDGLEVTEGIESRALVSAPPETLGIECDTCHVPHVPTEAGGGLSPLPSAEKVGPTPGLATNPFHGFVSGEEGEVSRARLSDGSLCSSCHDVRPRVADAVTGEPFLRAEDLASEWARSPWADPDHPQNPLRGRPGVEGVHDGREESGERVTCVDCHMSLYPARGFGDRVTYAEHFSGVDPALLTRKAHKVYPVGRAVSEEAARRSLEGAPLTHALRARRVSTHAFAGVSRPLDPFPAVSIFDLEAALGLGEISEAEGVDLEARRLAEVSAHAESRRVALLRAALTLSLDDLPRAASRHEPLELRLWVENTGAGHNVPAGFSQEREVWVALEVEDEGRACASHDDCADLIEPRLFLDAPNRWCTPLTPLGAPDPATPAQGSWEEAGRRERSGRCGARGRCVLYRSGYLDDLDGDGRSADEDLRHALVTLDPQTFEESCALPGPDADTRLSGAQRGLVWFTNALQRVRLDASGRPALNPRATPPTAPPYDPFSPEARATPVWAQAPASRRSAYPEERARHERSQHLPPLGGDGRSRGLTAPALTYANHAFNGEALRPFEPRLARYVIQPREGVVGPLRVSARVRFRFFSPRLLRALAARAPHLLSEPQIDSALLVVDMAEGERLVRLED